MGFLALNPAFARPASGSLAVQWSRIRGREDVEVHGPRVTTARYEENDDLQQRRVRAITRRVIAARVQARQQRAAGVLERDRSHALAEHTRRVADRARTQPAARTRRARTGRVAEREEHDRAR